jgi:Tol biopolymer transport system component
MRAAYGGLEMRRRTLLAISGTALAAVLVLSAGASPGSAAFPGTNGRIAYTCQPDGIEMCVIDADGSRLGYLTRTDQDRNFDEHYATWSPNGRQIAFVVVGYCTNAIFVMNADRTGLRRVHIERAARAGIWTIHGLSWSPDANKLVYSKAFHPGLCPYEFPADRHQLYTISVDGTNEQRIPSGGEAETDVDPEWSPNGASIAYNHDLPAFNAGLFLVNPDGSGRRRLDYRGGHPSWSPDGTKIAYECFTTRLEVCVYDVSSGTRTTLGLGSTPAWSPDGMQIAFAVQPGQNQADVDGGIFVMAANGANRREIVSKTGYASDGMGLPDWQPCPGGTCPRAPGMPTHVKRRKVPQTLSAKVGPGFTIAIRNKAGRRVKKLVEDTYTAWISDRSPRHSFHVSSKGGKFDARSSVKQVGRLRHVWALAPGRYRYFCDAHPRRMRGQFSVVAEPLDGYRP